MAWPPYPRPLPAWSPTCRCSKAGGQGGGRGREGVLLRGPAAPAPHPAAPAGAGHVHTGARVGSCRPPHPPRPPHTHAGHTEDTGAPGGSRPLYSLQEAENFLSATTTSASTTQVASRAAMTMAAMAPGPSEPAGQKEGWSARPASLPTFPPSLSPSTAWAASYRCRGPVAPARCCPRGWAGRWGPGRRWLQAPGRGWCSPRGLLPRAGRPARSTGWARAPAGPRLQGQAQGWAQAASRNGSPGEMALSSGPWGSPARLQPSVSQVRQLRALLLLGPHLGEALQATGHGAQHPHTPMCVCDSKPKGPLYPKELSPVHTVSRQNRPEGCRWSPCPHSS